MKTFYRLGFTLVVQDDKNKQHESPEERLSFSSLADVFVCKGEFKACQSIHERSRQHWTSTQDRQKGEEGISSLEESLHDVLGDVSKLRCWQYCIGKVFVTIWSHIRMETCLNTEREGRGQSTGIHSVPGKTGILLLALQRNTRPLQFDSRPQKKH